MAQDSSLFEVNEDTGEVIYTPSEDEVAADPEEQIAEGEEIEDVGDVTAPSDEVGDVVLDSENVPENLEEIEEEASSLDILESGDSGVPVVLSEDVTAAILAASPAGGSIGSSTLDYFDRVVSGLPADYKYIAYRTSSENSYDAVLYYGDDYEISGDVITFQEAVQLEVERVSSSGYNTETNYSAEQISDTSVSFSQSGTVVYYTNAAEGYPVLGGYDQQKGYDFFIVPALIGAMAVVVLTKLMFRR